VPQGCHSTEESKYATVTMNINHDPNVGWRGAGGGLEVC
jgi:hypothetical protein